MYGWNEEWAEKAAPYFSEEKRRIAGRVTQEHKGMYHVWTEEGTLLGEVSGKYRFEAIERGDYPAVGDWVVLEGRIQEGRGTIYHLLPRKSCFSRKAAGLTTDEQIVAANVDTIFLVMALNQDFNIRRLERYLTMAWESGSNPVIILSKADLCEDVDEKLAEVNGVSFGVPVHVVSAVENEGAGITELMDLYVMRGKTVALLGSSGVGKSTLINVFMGEEVQVVQDIREDDSKGRHTTTHRELFLMPEGGVLIDTPGMRELQLWESEVGFKNSFEDIENLSLLCRFRDCKHSSEPGCAVEQAIEDGELERSRFNSYIKLLKELAFLERKASVKAQLVEKQKGKQLTKWVRAKKKS
ncbi:ribosome small subunit-dependent GTPase A [Bacillus tamaricis]|uniref:Small ribosomal subunit biogenesis GTPase RsgA n=2 Tax=Evansella tamaricis TaxID=2069301 RepID=A0ABS6JKZ9_9BACI|nr:ribosome small subunit-dependent GTPase A [Evansella tamaricis]